MSKNKVVVIDRVLNQGVHDAMFNINFATYMFTPVSVQDQDSGRDKVIVDPNLMISCRLRMGENCLRELKMAIDYLVGLADEGRRKRAGEIPATVSESAGQDKPN